MNKFRVAFLIALSLVCCLGASCQHSDPLKPQPDDPPPYDPGPMGADAAPAPTTSCVSDDDGCNSAYKASIDKGCPITSTKAGVCWSIVCANAQKNGLDMKTHCIQSSSDCSAIKACTSTPPH